MSDALRIETLHNQFKLLYGSPPAILVRAPGRVNLIGEHTDYNDGFVFPAAIERNMLIALSPRKDSLVNLNSLDSRVASSFSMDHIQPAEEGKERWSNYFRAMIWVLQRERLEMNGADCLIQGNIPPGSGLSSSAAFLVASGLALACSAGVELNPVRLALLAQQGEREFVGVNVGIMDQFISALGRKDHALLIDTRSLTYESVPLPASGVSIVIADTNKKRGLVDSEYNSRRAECEAAVRLLQKSLPSIKALRDVSQSEFEGLKSTLPEPVLRRARHVITENARTLESVDALKVGDISRFGKLMNQSHNSLRDDYQVSCSELDSMVEAASGVDGVYGSRMTGAGFGGCTVSLVKDSALAGFLAEVPRLYKAATGLEASLLVTTAADGAGRIF